MGVLKSEAEFRSSIAPERLFRALVLDSDNFIPKVSPNDIKSVEILEGDGGVGTIRQITYTDRSKYKYAKQKIEAIDQDNLQITYSLIEGGALTDKIEKITYINKFVEAPGGGTVIKSISEYYTIGDEDRSITNDDKIKEHEEKYTHTFNILGNYLLDNYDAYN